MCSWRAASVSPGSHRTGSGRYDVCVLCVRAVCACCVCVCIVRRAPCFVRACVRACVCACVCALCVLSGTPILYTPPLPPLSYNPKPPSKPIKRIPGNARRTATHQLRRGEERGREDGQSDAGAPVRAEPQEGLRVLRTARVQWPRPRSNPRPIRVGGENGNQDHIMYSVYRLWEVRMGTRNRIRYDVD